MTSDDEWGRLTIALAKVSTNAVVDEIKRRDVGSIEGTLAGVSGLLMSLSVGIGAAVRAQERAGYPGSLHGFSEVLRIACAASLLRDDEGEPSITMQRALDALERAKNTLESIVTMTEGIPESGS